MIKAEGSYAMGKEAKTEWSIVPGSGTGELKGISGKGSAVAQNHTNDTPYTLEYTLK